MKKWIATDQDRLLDLHTDPMGPRVYLYLHLYKLKLIMVVTDEKNIIKLETSDFTGIVVDYCVIPSLYLSILFVFFILLVGLL